MDQEFDLQGYLKNGVQSIVRRAVQATMSNPAESLFLAKFAVASTAATQRRAEEEKRGLHVPPFLIASITSSCNLHCAGCYARANHACGDEKPLHQLTHTQWKSIFEQADTLGISFILLAGGEPLLRKDVISVAAQIPNIVFPVFTNGTMLEETYLSLLGKHRNLVPILSIEGEQTATDQRRGNGVYKQLVSAMDSLHKMKLLYGVSVTVTTQNFKEVTSEQFLTQLSDRGCQLMIFVEYVPITETSAHLALTDRERAYLKERVDQLRNQYGNMLLISFPGDEKSSGGCLAAGRGFFHINSHGGAEPCPFSPYSDINVSDTSVREALLSGLFQRLQKDGALLEEHVGGCVLFEKKDQVERLLAAQS